MDVQDEEVALLHFFILGPTFLSSKCATYSRVWSLLACLRLTLLATCVFQTSGRRKRRKRKLRASGFLLMI